MGKSEMSVGEGGRRALDRIEPCGTSVKQTFGVSGGGSAGGRRVVDAMSVEGKFGAGSGGGRRVS